MLCQQLNVQSSLCSYTWDLDHNHFKQVSAFALSQPSLMSRLARSKTTRVRNCQYTSFSGCKLFFLIEKLHDCQFGGVFFVMFGIKERKRWFRQ